MGLVTYRHYNTDIVQLINHISGISQTTELINQCRFGLNVLAPTLTSYRTPFLNSASTLIMGIQVTMTNHALIQVSYSEKQEIRKYSST